MISSLSANESLVNMKVYCSNFTQADMKNGNKYLTGQVQDATGVVNCKKWNTGNQTIENGVYYLTGKTQEYNGAIEITATDLTPCEEQDLSEFRLKYVDDNVFEWYVEQTRAVIESMGEGHIKEVTKKVFEDIGLWAEEPGKEPIAGTAAVKIHHAGWGGWLRHSYDVAQGARAISNMYYGCGVDLDLLTAGALLHDIGKIRGYGFESDGITYSLSDIGKLLEHTVLGVMEIEKYKTPENKGALENLQHIIASHHELLEHGAATTPRTIEARIVSKADYENMIASMIRREIAKDNEEFKIFGVRMESPKVTQSRVVGDNLNG